MLYFNNLPQLALSLTAVLVALTIHEFSHALAAHKLGDSTAMYLGRLTLNPLKHLDPIGALFMVFFRFGWAKPVPINARNFKNPRKGFAISALAGPLSNVITAFITMPVLLLFVKLYAGSIGSVGEIFLYNTCYFLRMFVSLNVGLGVFNLIPVPPFDGSRILNVILPPKLYFGIMKYERYIYWGVIAWLFLGDYVYMGLMSVPFIATNPILSGISSIFNLSGLIGKAIDAIYNGILSVWQLIPFLKVL